MPTINDSVQFLKGVGPAFAKKFEKLGILTIRDLLLCYPRKYIDYTQPYTVVSAPYDVECCVRATVLQKEPARRVKGGRVMNRVLAADDSGILALSWFNAPSAAAKLDGGGHRLHPDGLAVVHPLHLGLPVEHVHHAALVVGQAENHPAGAGTAM